MHGFRALQSLFRQPPKLNVPRTLVTEVDAAVSHDAEHSKASLLQEADAFNVRELVTMTEMVEKRMHLGHKKTLLNPYMQPFAYGSRFDQIIIDLEKSREHLVRALNFVAHIAYNDGIILFVSRHFETAYKVEQCAKECKEFAHVRSWHQGVLTNAENSFGTEIRLPDCGLFLTTRGSQVAVKEFARLLIPTVGIVDTDSDPRLITYPVPGNDDTAETISYYLSLFKEAILRGKERRKQALTSDSGTVE